MMNVSQKNPADYNPDDEAADGPEEETKYFSVPAELGGMRFDAVLARLFPQHSRSRLQGWIKEGAIRLNGAQVDAKHKVWGGEEGSMDAVQAPEDMAALAEAMPLDIVFEDE